MEGTMNANANALIITGEADKVSYITGLDPEGAQILLHKHGGDRNAAIQAHWDASSYPLGSFVKHEDVATIGVVRMRFRDLVAVEGIGWENLKDAQQSTEYPSCPRRWVWLLRTKLSAVPLEEIPVSTFSLGMLPRPVLSLVFRKLPVAEGAVISRTCSHFVKAFRDAVMWRAATIAALQPLSAAEVEARFAGQQLHRDWFTFYRYTCLWKIVVVDEKRFSVHYVEPSMSPADFACIVKGMKKPPRPPGKWGNLKMPYRPLEPARSDAMLKRYFCDQGANHVVLLPNCTWDPKQPTIAQAGLCEGAILKFRVLSQRMAFDEGDWAMNAPANQQQRAGAVKPSFLVNKK